MKKRNEHQIGIDNIYSQIQEDPTQKKLNLGCGQDIRPPHKNWINVDGVSSSLHVQQMNIFKLPWSFESDSFDYILARHILEHVPHNISEYGYDVNFLQLLTEEIWRVMKVGGILDIEVPEGISSLTKAIDHKRIITTETFHIFYPEDKWSYYTNCRFELVYVNSFESLRFKILKAFLKKVFDVDITYLKSNSNNFRFLLRKLSMSS